MTYRFDDIENDLSPMALKISFAIFVGIVITFSLVF